MFLQYPRRRKWDKGAVPLASVHAIIYVLGTGDMASVPLHGPNAMERAARESQASEWASGKSELTKRDGDGSNSSAT